MSGYNRIKLKGLKLAPIFFSRRSNATQGYVSFREELMIHTLRYLKARAPALPHKLTRAYEIDGFIAVEVGADMFICVRT